jgi:hypothetical protein
MQSLHTLQAAFISTMFPVMLIALNGQASTHLPHKSHLLPFTNIVPIHPSSLHLFPASYPLSSMSLFLINLFKTGP